MKKLKIILMFFVVCLLFSENCFAATTETSQTVTNITKYIAIGIAVLVVILLLLLGYKMDSREDEPDDYMTKRNKKKEKNGIVKEDPKYEADKVVYEPDNINTNDISESIEYDENEEKLFSTMNDADSPEDILDDNNVNLDELDDMLDNFKDESEEYGEDFDTSIIDSIDEDNVPQNPKKDIDETIIFNNVPVDKLWEDNGLKDEVEEESIKEKDDEVDSLLKELDSLDEYDSESNDFLETNDDSDKKENTENKKNHKKYTKAKKVSTSTDDFLAQIEENLKKDKEERDSKKSKKN